MVDFKIIQENIGPAGYFRDPNGLKDYIADSIFLPYINNEKSYQATYKQRFDAVNAALFIMFSQDHVIYPPETAIFGEL